MYEFCDACKQVTQQHLVNDSLIECCRCGCKWLPEYDDDDPDCVEWHDASTDHGKRRNAHGHCWIRRASGEILLAYMTNGKFQYADTVGDRDGCGIQYFEDVTHWANLTVPEFRVQER